MMFLGAIFFGYVVSTTTLFMEKYSTDRQEIMQYHEKIDDVEAWAKVSPTQTRKRGRARE